MQSYKVFSRSSTWEGTNIISRWWAVLRGMTWAKPYVPFLDYVLYRTSHTLWTPDFRESYHELALLYFRMPCEVRVWVYLIVLASNDLFVSSLVLKKFRPSRWIIQWIVILISYIGIPSRWLPGITVCLLSSKIGIHLIIELHAGRLGNHNVSWRFARVFEILLNTSVGG